MAIIGGAGAAREREYLFIDGGCLRSAIKKISKDVFHDEAAFQPYLPALAETKFDKVFYYDAVPGKQHGEAQAAYEVRVQPDYNRFADIQALDRVHVGLGQIVGADRRQKGVDVRLAVDMMTHAFRGNIARATLFAGDADFTPLLKSLVGEGLHVTLWHPAQANAELKGAADSVRPFSFKANYNCFSANAERPAFAPSSSGGGMMDPNASGLTNVVEVEGTKYAGSWDEESLSVWRHSGSNHWEYYTLRIHGIELQRALIGFDEIHGWGVSETGAKWIQRTKL